MSRDILVDQTIEVLRHAGFMVSDRCDIRPRSFDIAARRGDTLLLCKILLNLDGLTEETANEMRVLSEILGGTPLVIGEKTRDQPLEDNVIYMRYKITAVNIHTFYDYFIEGIPPLVSASPGGLYVPIDGNALKEARIENNLSLGSLAGIIGVSRRTISKYEEEGMHASIDTVLILEDLLQIELAQPIDILNPTVLMNQKTTAEPSNPNPVKVGGSISGENKPPSSETVAENELLTYVSTLGFDVKETAHAPFRAVSKDKNSVILTGVSKYNASTLKRAHLMSSISDVLQTDAVFLINGNSKVKSVESTAFIEKKELVKMSGPEDLIETIEERKVPEKK
ncbi:transcriptional regulator [Methanimicrococcus blatticola]|uniref:Putative HTH-type transcriptional regulatory protein C7391_0798 n=1 Tax=Methanimicrococcus blatticola TaxID=91560 RepID=A0A484F557_9EURY|nr:transcriptional regulator [Methanimicrococcus blatticola]MBZ3935522.1 transcriptional regulator [Methanimicrococcus blatticola]MCC2509165.1 transcriptional regulator [Methanimicrococcus blatticola]TDQ69470.1 putative transcriptional regulator [Methanimicrococcus blatticola]